MEWITIDLSVIGGLITLITLEVVLGIDNLVFIAILAQRLPSSQQALAMKTGLAFALILRIAMLASLSWIISLTDPVFHVSGRPLSARDIILILGGAFLLFKATLEIHKRIEGNHQNTNRKDKTYANFWYIIMQIIAIDAVFSIDSVITAIGMVNELLIMVTAVIISMILMIIASRPLKDFIDRHPTLIMLCLGFLLMIGLLLVAEGFGYHIPKGYIYTAIAFSLSIEFLNHYSKSKRKA